MRSFMFAAAYILFGCAAIVGIGFFLRPTAFSDSCCKPGCVCVKPCDCCCCCPGK